MTKREMQERIHTMNALRSHGVTEADFHALRRISMQLHNWHELECGTDRGCVERDEATGKAYWRSAFTGKRTATRDMETGALKRLACIMTRYPALASYIQGDPRGAALYILRPGDVPAGQNAESYYTRGICIY